MTVLDFIKEKKFLFSPTFDRRLRRFDRNGKFESAWAIGKIVECPAGNIQHLSFGDFAEIDPVTGKSLKYNWYSRKASTKEEQALIDQAMAADSKAYQEERDAKQESAHLRVVEIMRGLGLGLPGSMEAEPKTLRHTTGYSLAKGLSSLHGAFINAAGEIVVPMRDAWGKLWNLQRISANGTKGFFRNGKILGNFFQIGEVTEGRTIYVCEGYATGVSIYEALQGRASYINRFLDAPVGSPANIMVEGLKDLVAQSLLSACGPAGETAALRLRCETRGSTVGGEPARNSQGGRGLGALDRSQPGTVGGQIQSVVPTRRPLAPPPNGGQSQKCGPGSGVVDGHLGDDAAKRVGQGSAQSSVPGRGAQGSGFDGESDPTYLSGPDATLQGPGFSHSRTEPQTSSRDRDRRRRRSALEWNPEKQRAPERGRLQSTGLSGSRDVGQDQRASDACVIVAFNTANLGHVVRALKAKYPDGQIVICGDEDIWGRTVEGFKSENAGRLAALKAAGTYGCQVVFPRFDTVLGCDRLKPTDFNDMACLTGLASVAIAIAEQLASGTLPPSKLSEAYHLRLDMERIQPDGVQTPQKSIVDIGDSPGLYPLSIGPHLSREIEDTILEASRVNQLHGKSSQQVNSDPLAQDTHIPWSENSAETERAEDLEQGINLGGPLTGMTAKGAPTMPPHQDIVERLLHVFKGKLVKQDRDLFRFVGTHWKLLSMGDIDRLKTGVQELCDGIAQAWEIEGIWKLFVMHLPGVPEGRNMFTPDPWCANFLNGTLKVSRTAQGYQSSFHVHRSNDYLVNVLPLHFPTHTGIVGDGNALQIPEPGTKASHESGTDSPTFQEFNQAGVGTAHEVRNAVFEDMLDRVFAGDADASEKRRAVGQMYGACLLPAFAHLFMLYGPPGTGKSTVIKLAVRLVHKNNTSSVQPCDFRGFNLASMAGKLVNYDPDINTNKPIEDHIVKKIEDRIPMRIERKNLPDLYAPLPSVHLFGGNKIPPTNDGASRAYDRRCSFIGFHKILITGGEYDLDYAERCWDAGPEGILAFALEGLQDLLQSRGHFINPVSGKAKMEEWQMSNDPVGQFLSAVDAGEVLDGNTTITREADALIERPRLYLAFAAWCKAMLGSSYIISSHRFYERMEGHGFGQRRTSKARFVVGLRIGAGAGSQC